MRGLRLLPPYRWAQAGFAPGDLVPGRLYEGRCNPVFRPCRGGRDQGASAPPLSLDVVGVVVVVVVVVEVEVVGSEVLVDVTVLADEVVVESSESSPVAISATATPSPITRATSRASRAL